MTGQAVLERDATKGYKYKDSKGENGPVKIAQIKKTPSGVFQIKAVIDGKHGAVSVVPPNTGTVGCAQLTIGGGDSYSVRFAERPAVIDDKARDAQFKVKKPTPRSGTLHAVRLPRHERLPVSRSRATTSRSPIRPPTPAAASTSPTPACRGTTPASSVEPSDYNRNDGFSPGASMLTQVPNVDLGVTGARADHGHRTVARLRARRSWWSTPRPSPIT